MYPGYTISCLAWLFLFFWGGEGGLVTAPLFVFHFICTISNSSVNSSRPINLKIIIYHFHFSLLDIFWQSLHPTAPIWTGCAPCLIQGFCSEISLHRLLGHLFLSRIPVFWFHCWLLSWFTLLFKSTSSHSILANSACKINFLSPYMCSKSYQVWGVKLSLSNYRILDWNSLFLFGIAPLVYLSDSSPYDCDWFSSHISKMLLGSSYP